MSTTKLEKLLIGEVSGVDDPANLLPGWMVTKAAGRLAVGPDLAVWDVGEAESRIREATGAVDAPTSDYAKCFLYVDKAAADSFGGYKFLVSDVVDGEIAVMPAAVRAAEQRLEGSSIPDDDKAAIAGVLKSITEQIETPAEPEDATSIVGKIKKLLLGKENDVTKDELTAALEERDNALVEKFAEIVTKSVESAPTGEAATSEGDPPADPTGDTAAVPAADELVPALTAEDIVKAVEDAQAPLLEILDKALDRIEKLERGGISRKSIEGQDTTLNDGDEPVVPTVKSAIAKALGRGATA